MKALFLSILLFPTVSFAWKGPDSDAYMLNSLRWGAKYEAGLDYQQNVYYGAKPEIMKQHKVSTVKSFKISKHGKNERGNVVKRTDCYKSTDKSLIITSFHYSEKNLIQEVTYKSGSKVQFEYSYL